MKKEVFCCDGPKCTAQTDSVKIDEWIEVNGYISAYMGRKDESTPEAMIPFVYVGSGHYCCFQCLEDALLFPDELEGEDASEEVGPCPGSDPS